MKQNRKKFWRHAPTLWLMKIFYNSHYSAVIFWIFWHHNFFLFLRQKHVLNSHFDFTPVLQGYKVFKEKPERQVGLDADKGIIVVIIVKKFH